MYRKVIGFSSVLFLGIGGYACSKRNRLYANTNPLFIGIDLGATNAKAGVVDNNGKLISRSSKKIDDYKFESVMDLLVDVTKDALSSSNLQMKDIAGIGIGSPGLLDYENGVLKSAANFPWKNAPITDYVSKKTGIPCTLENDGNAAAAAEYWVGSGKGYKSLVMLTLGSGVGCGFVEEGRILHGGFDMGAETGHMIVEKEGRKCGCGQKGCLETYTSANAVARIAKEKLESTDKPSILRNMSEKNKEITCKDVFDALGKGDELAKDVIDYAVSYLAVGCVNVCRTFDPQVIVMTGGMAEAGDVLFNKINEEYPKYNWTIMKPLVKIVPATAGPHAGIIGAAAAARQKYVENHSH